MRWAPCCALSRGQRHGTCQPLPGSPLTFSTLWLLLTPPAPFPHNRRLSFDDLHSHGIYTWPLLHDLGSHKLSRMRRYLRALGDRGLSRDPPALLHRRQRASGEGGAMQQQQQQQDAGDASGAGGGVAANGTNGSTSAAGSRIPGSSSGDSSGTSVSREGAGQRGKQQRGNGGGGGSSAPNPG